VLCIVPFHHKLPWLLHRQQTAGKWQVALFTYVGNKQSGKRKPFDKSMAKSSDSGYRHAYRVQRPKDSKRQALAFEL
jgi:hypothetical protein